MAKDRRGAAVTSVRILAPAKVNLGLAILGKRADGYHEIDTIMAMIGLYDEIVITPQSASGIRVSGMDDVPTESNLMTKAARLWSEASGVEPGWHIQIDKHIPSPAGLGGGSSNAAAVLKALNALHSHIVPAADLHHIASGIGADSPFFLAGPAARATGIGTDLRSVDPPQGWVVLAVPHVKTASKTATLYGALTSADFMTSADISPFEATGTHVMDMPNSFLRPAKNAFPELTDLLANLKTTTGHAALSGAGPAAYAIAQSEFEAAEWAEQIHAHVASDVRVITAPFLQSSPEPEFLP